ncbi:rhomboid family intramembrane serine protease [Paenibacillus soyae]|uniref:Rhomboid family intramembrane serine protease n=1 Tax=Paenibacillus soyae TaxID=2969249 RepID=A0A9X2MLW2_9BACL|nr:rhomboid family intramembrane serine protease [Paenibacillus soyae]MCR2802740.1 rhomboid family intramembrane serine protease [Paenibacillus soyae]
MFQRNESLKEYVRHYPVVSLLLAINIALFVAMEVTGSSKSVLTLLQFGAVTNEPGFLEPWDFVSAMFLHIGFMHLLMNGFALYIFAAPLETLFGKWRFLLLYLASGLIGNVVSLYLHQDPYVGAGASGAIYGVYASYIALTLFRKSAVGHTIRKTFLTIFAVGVIYSIITPNVDLYAHLGGFIGGFLVTMLYRR